VCEELQLFQVGSDLGARPILRRDEFAANHAVLVDDVALGNLKRAVEAVDARRGIANGEKVDVVLVEKAPVDGIIFILADGDDDDIGHLVVELNEAGKLDDAWRTPGGPKVEDDGVAAVLTEVDGLDAVAYGEVWRNRADLVGMASAVAPGDQQHCEDYTCPDFTHITLHFL
jgi:hypothetical protein